jgi:hypothetical protein
LVLLHRGEQPLTASSGCRLLEQVQHDFGEGPCLLAYDEDRVVAIEDLGSERVWDRLAAVVGQLRVRGC